jgi:hypothetical protein
MAAMYFNNTAIRLEDGEASAMAEGIKNVARHYDIVRKVSPEAQDWANLLIITTTIYSAKFMLARQPLAPAAPEDMYVRVVPDAQQPHATPGDAPIVLPEVVAQKAPPSGNVMNVAGNSTFYPEASTPGDAYVQ